MAEPSLGAALERVQETESTPPLWYALAWAVEQSGVPVEAARGLGVAAGALLAGLLVVYGGRFLPLWAAGFAGLLVALSSQLVLRGAELRAYALYALLALAFAWLLERAAEAPRAGRLAVLAAATAAGLLTHYFFLFVMAAGLAWLWTRPSLRPARRRVLAATALALAPFLAWTPFLAQQVENQRFSWIGDFSFLKAAAVYSAFVWNAGPLYVRELVEVGRPEALARVGVFVLVVAGCAAAWRAGARGRLVALLALGPVVLGALLWLAGENLFTARNVLASAPFAALAVAALAAALPRAAGVAGGAALLALAVAGLVREHRLEPPAYDRIADELVELGWGPGSQLALYGGAHEVSYLGSAYAIRGPVSWYLPGRPAFVLYDRAPQPCERAFAVAPPGRGARVVDRAEEARTVDGLTVARVPCADDLRRRVGRSAGFLFVPTDP